jgi:hypothetical protein
MGNCQRCGGTGKLQAGFNEAGQSQYMTCEVCCGSGDSENPTYPSPTKAGCAVFLAFAAAAMSSLATVAAFGVWAG